MTFWQMFWVTIGSIFSFAILLILLIQGSKYSVNDTRAHSADYGGVIKEGHGGMTSFLWVMFIGILVWTIVYLIMHWSEFAIIWAYAQ
jgi:hypothetical protein